MCVGVRYWMAQLFEGLVLPALCRAVMSLGGAVDRCAWTHTHNMHAYTLNMQRLKGWIQGRL